MNLQPSLPATSHPFNHLSSIHRFTQPSSYTCPAGWSSCYPACTSPAVSSPDPHLSGRQGGPVPSVPPCFYLSLFSLSLSRSLALSLSLSPCLRTEQRGRMALNNNTLKYVNMSVSRYEPTLAHTHTQKHRHSHNQYHCENAVSLHKHTLRSHTHTPKSLYFNTQPPHTHTHTHTSYKNISLKEKSCVTFSFSTHSTCKTHVTHTIKSHVYISCRTSIKLSGCSKLQFITDNYRVIIG